MQAENPVLVANRQRPDDALGSRGDPGRGQGAISEELGCVEGVGEAGGNRVRRLEQRGAVAFAAMAAVLRGGSAQGSTKCNHPYSSKRGLNDHTGRSK